MFANSMNLLLALFATASIAACAGAAAPSDVAAIDETVVPALELTTPTPTPTPIATPSPPDLPTPSRLIGSSAPERMTLEEELADERAVLEANRLRRETRIDKITVNGRDIDLPVGVELTGVISNILCVAPNPCPETPIFVLESGKSRINISAPTGVISGETLAPGEEHAFDSIKEALR